VWHWDEIARAGAGGVVVFGGGMPWLTPLCAALAAAHPANAAESPYHWPLSVDAAPVLWANSRHVALSLVSNIDLASPPHATTPTKCRPPLIVPARFAYYTRKADELSLVLHVTANVTNATHWLLALLYSLQHNRHSSSYRACIKFPLTTAPCTTRPACRFPSSCPHVRLV
jgi:hypothetical protein